MRRVVVTGMGIVSPLGCGVSHVWDKLSRSVSGIKAITEFETEDLACRIGGVVPASDEAGAASSGLFNINDFLDVKEQRKIGRFIALGIAAVDEAIRDAGWRPTDNESLEKTGVLMGAGIGGLSNIEDNAVLLHEKGARRVSPFFIPSALINLTSGHVAIRHGFKGPNHSVVTACASGSHAIGDAMRLIQYGDADVMVAGGSEATVTRLGISGFASMRALSTQYNDRPEEGSRPWDDGRDGFVMGEGSGVLVLEELEHAKKRGAKIYAELVGYGLSGDAYHVTAPAEDGDGAYRSMRMAVKRAEIAPEQIGYINAHGTSTPMGDMIEIKAVRRLMGDHVGSISMSSTKSSTGHLLGAAGAVEAIFSIQALLSSLVPPTLNLHNPSDGCEGIDLVPLKAKEKTFDYALSNSFGFGGTNASLIFKRYDA
jgi:3-oxoacyl-[acyl-carrier-protein] synthase II